MSKAIVGARVVPVEGEPIDGGTVLLEEGKIAAVGGPGFAVPDDAEVVDAAGKGVPPGLIAAHAHAGAAEAGAGRGGPAVNGATLPGTRPALALGAGKPGAP